MGESGRVLFLNGVYVGDPEGSARFCWIKTLLIQAMAHLLGHSVTYRIPIRPQTGPSVFILQLLPACAAVDYFGYTVGKVVGLSLHAVVAARTHERKKPERVCRAISRAMVLEQRLPPTPNENFRHQVKELMVVPPPAWAPDYWSLLPVWPQPCM